MAGILSIQIQPILNDKIQNLKKIEKLLDLNKEKTLDLVVLPEFFSTGISHYSFKNYPEDENGGFVIEAISKLAQKYNTNIVAGTVIEKSENKLYNTSFIIDKNGNIADKYRKIHLFKFLGGKEDEIITQGNEIKTVNLDIGKVGLGICYDIRYPMHFNKLIKNNADFIILPTAWAVSNSIYNDKEKLSSEKSMWLSLCKIRAYDNMVYFITSNQTGKSNDKLSCIGNSCIVSPYGEILTQAKYEECAIYYNCDKKIADELKNIYPMAKID